MVLISVNGEKNIVLDLGKCRYFDNGGLSTILVGNRLCKNRGGTFVLTGLNDSIERLIVSIRGRTYFIDSGDGLTFVAKKRC